MTAVKATINDVEETIGYNVEGPIDAYTLEGSASTKPTITAPDVMYLVGVEEKGDNSSVQANLFGLGPYTSNDWN